MSKIDWSQNNYWPALKLALENERKPLVSQLSLEELHQATGVFVPKSTVKSALKRLVQKKITHENVFPSKTSALLSNDQVDFVQDIIVKRDQDNNGVSRKEAIDIIYNLAGEKKMKDAENHYDYLIRKARLNRISRGGKVTAAQSTTSEHCGITVPQKLRWRVLVDTVWEDLHVSNQPSHLFIKLHKHFQLNLD